MGARASRHRTRRLWRDYSLSITLAGLFLAAWAGQAVTQWWEVHREAAAHHQPFQVSEYLIQFGRATFENWQSEWLQLLTFVVLTVSLRHRGSHESKEVDD